MAFALYANELKKSKPQISYPTTDDTVEEAPPTKHVLGGKLMRFYQTLSTDPIFKTGADGLKVLRTEEGVSVQLFGEEVYSNGEFSIRETWYSALDRLAELIKAEIPNGLQVEVQGYADDSSELEKKNTEFGRSEYAFAFSRAEWLAHYFEGKWRIPLKGVFTLKGMGAFPHAKKVVLNFSYPP